MRTLLFVSLLVIAGCSATSKGSRPPIPDSVQPETQADQSGRQPANPADGIPMEAFELLTKSATDSCSVCARDLRRKAFRILEERYSPGAIVMSDSTSWFMSAPGSANGLILATDPRADVKLTFRFHTAEDHLVGISESDMTDGSLADRCRSAPQGTAFQGALEIVAFRYGDGPTFLYHASDNSVEVHCRILELVAY